MRRIWDKTGITAIAGLLAYAVTILVLFIPFKEEPTVSLVNWSSTLGIFILILFAVSVVLYGIGIFKRDKRLSRNDMNAIVEQRQEYLPQLRNTVESILVRMSELAVKAGELPLEDYYEKYLKQGKAYTRIYRTLGFTHKDEAIRRQVAIMTALHAARFAINHPYLAELEDGDSDGMVRLRQEYNVHRGCPINPLPCSWVK